MSWQPGDGATLMVRVITQQEPWSIDTCSWWYWDPGRLVEDKFGQRLVWDPDIEGSIHGGLTQRHTITHWFVWYPGIGPQLHWATRLVHMFGLLEGKQSWGGRIFDVPFSSVSYGMVRMDFQGWRQTGACLHHQYAQGILEMFHRVLRSFYGIR